MADSKITALTSISTSTDPANDPLVIVDVSDTSMAATGTTKKVTLNQLLGASGTATLASATITGDLTVDTSTLKVDSANNRVGIGTASPTAALEVNLAEVSSASGTSAIISNTTGGGNRIAALRLQNLSNQWNIRAYGSVTDDLRFGSGVAGSEVDYLSIGNTGIFTWSNVGGVAGTAMTLNATGLGVGVSPSFKLDIDSTSGTVVNINSTNANGPGLRFSRSGTVNGYVGSAKYTVGGALADFSIDAAGANNLIFGVNDVERMRIDTSGNVGIGVTPSAWSSGIKVLEFGTKGGLAGSGSDVNLIYNAYYDGSNKYRTSDYANNFQISGGQFKWLTAPSGTAGNVITYTQAMTLDASGNLLVGTTAQSSNERLRVNNTASNGWAVTMTSTTRGWLNRQSDANGGIAAYFEVGSGNTNVGSINTTSSGTSFVTTSDYRLKENVQPLVGGLARVSALKPSIYKWKIDGSNGEGFLAHELAEVVPAAVTGEKDAVNEDGSIKAQGVDLSKVVPVLVAAIQELTARVQTLETR